MQRPSRKKEQAHPDASGDLSPHPVMPWWDRSQAGLLGQNPLAANLQGEQNEVTIPHLCEGGAAGAPEKGVDFFLDSACLSRPG